jgi:hypothetical protein
MSPEQMIHEWSWDEGKSYREITARAIQKNGFAKESYEKLLAAGFRDGEHLQFLIGLIVSSSSTASRVKWFTGSGQTTKTFPHFLERVRRVVDEIERLHRNSWLSPDLWDHGPVSEECKKAAARFNMPATEFRKKMTASFRTLPSVLENYAAVVESKWQTFERELGKRRLMAPRKELLASLFQMVRGETGRPMFSEVSQVLMAAADEAGASDRGLDEQSLKTADAEIRRLTAARKVVPPCAHVSLPPTKRSDWTY